MSQLYLFRHQHQLTNIDGKVNLKSENCKSANSWAHSAIANPQISQVCQSANANAQVSLIYPQITISKISTKCCTTLSQNSPKSFKRIFQHFCYIYCIGRKCMCLRTCGITSHKRDWVCKFQIRKVPHFWKVHNSNKLFKFANLRICNLQTYLQTAHLC